MPNFYARQLRKQMPLAELRVWGLLRKKQFGVRFNRQEPIGKYIVDFICHKAKLIIEVDGEHHFYYGNDASRDEYLRSQGYNILRLTNYEVRRDILEVCNKISGALSYCLQGVTSASPRLGKLSPQATEGVELVELTPSVFCLQQNPPSPKLGKETGVNLSIP